MELCKLCNIEFKNKKSLQMHLSMTHKLILPQLKEYYDLHYKTNTEGLDPFTNNPTNFVGFTKGYSIFDGSTESNKKKIASSTVEYWVKVKGYTEAAAMLYLSDKHKRSSIKANDTKSKLLKENPARRFLGGYGKTKFELMGHSPEEAERLFLNAKDQRAINFRETYKERPDMFKGKRMGQIEYWLNKGFSKDEAKNKVSKSQATFTLKKCIKKYGEVEGTKKFNNRQTKWSANIEQKYKNGEFTRFCEHNYSKAELKFVELLVSRSNLKDDEYYSATNGKQFFRCFKDEGVTLAYDFVYGKKIIEFNGDYWHCNPKLYEADHFNKSIQQTAAKKWEFDKWKNSLIEKEGYEVLVIWEKEYNDNPKQTIEKCIKYLNS